MKEGRLLLLVGLIQFINIIDFMMVVPMGPDLASGLGVPVHLIGIVAGSYTLAAAGAGFLGLFFLDRFQRRPALLWSLVGLVVATLFAAASWNLSSLLFARALAGVFGGALSALVLAIVADEIPADRRGDAMGKIMGAFAVASVLGVPFGLELSNHFGWHAPFLAFGLIGSVIIVVAFKQLKLSPRIIEPRTPREILQDAYEIVSNPLILSALVCSAVGMMSSFMIVPHIAAHVQINMHYPRQDMGLLYLFGGMVSFFSMRFAGRFTDRYSATKVHSVFSIAYVITVLCGFVFWQMMIPVIAIMIMYMVATSGRNVAIQTLSSKLPSSRHRAAFMSLNAATTHLATSLGAMISVSFLSEQPGRLVGIENVAILAIILSIPLSGLVYFIEKKHRVQKAQFSY